MDELEVWVNWPTYPLITKTGKVSKAKGAGKTVPLLSENVINNLHRLVYQNIRNKWEEAAREAAQGLVWTGDTPCVLDVILVKRTAQNIDSFAILEACKPIIDGMVRSDPGVWPDDNDNYVRGGTAVARKGADKFSLGLLICIRPLVGREPKVQVQMADQDQNEQE